MSVPVSSFLQYISTNAPFVKPGHMDLAPEQVLWREVAVQAVRDFDLEVSKIKTLVEAIGIAPQMMKKGLQEIINETKTEWFRDICEWAGTRPERITKLLEYKWTTEHNVDQYTFRNKSECVRVATSLIPIDPKRARTVLASLKVHRHKRPIIPSVY